MNSAKKQLNINLYRKRRYKPLYKKFINLKKNIQYRRKLVFYNFKKLKWQKFQNYMRKINFGNPTKNFVMFDHNRHNISTFFRYIFKKKFQYKLTTKKKFILFYGFLTEKYFKKSLALSLKNSKINNNKIKLNLFLIQNLEKRLDVTLYRSHFSSSIRGARQLISHKHVQVNKKTVKSNSYILKKGDLVEIKSKKHHLITSNVKNNHLWPIVPKHLHINYKTFQILIFQDIKTTNFTTHFPFWLDLNTLTNYYNC